jgi:hypothetical protein
MIYTNMEKKLVALVLNKGATKGEVENASRMFFASLRTMIRETSNWNTSTS